MTAKELKKKHSYRLVGGAEMGSRSREDLQPGSSWGRQVSGWWTGRGSSCWSRQFHICMQINWEEQLGSETDCVTQGSSMGEKKVSKPLAVKICGGCGSGRNSHLHKTVCWRDPQGPRMYTNPPTEESAPGGPNLLVDSRGSD